MTQEDKELLLKDLCARLPYHPIVSVAYYYINKGIVLELDVLSVKLLLGIEEEDSWEYIKPHLRPMSSMTEAESEEFANMEIVGYNNYDWLNKHHFDYRGLIERGLALEALEEMYNELKKLREE